jgi:hypothetical protein
VSVDPPEPMRQREQLRSGGLRGNDLLAWLREYPPAERDAAFERLLGIVHAETPRPPGDDRMPYMPSALAPVVRTVLDVPITGDDVFVDLGAGLGKATMAVHLLTGARARGVELQAELVAQGRARARDLGLHEVAFVEADALDADLTDATVIFLYLPFTGDVLAGVMRRIEAVARRRDLVLCALGLDLRGIDWIAERPGDEFWLSLYDTRIPGAAARRARAPSPLAAAGEPVARGL